MKRVNGGDAGGWGIDVPGAGSVDAVAAGACGRVERFGGLQSRWHCRCGDRQPGDAAIGVLPVMRGRLPGGLSGFPFEGNVTGIATGYSTAALACSAVAGSPTRIATGDFNRDGRLQVLMLRTFDGLT